ncbi:hypothetical protein PATSB16_01880 [Pandoraea thiooxydans]|nr:hypothetical protein PATSB16_01880 [Pandoraea thiooxydans]
MRNESKQTIQQDMRLQDKARYPVLPDATTSESALPLALFREAHCA